MMKLKEKLKKRGGFTLIEMLLVVAIVAILVVISIPMMMNSLDTARQAADDANERAAKAAGAIVYLTDGKIEVHYYDAAKGKLVPDKDDIALYGKVTNDPDDGDRTNKIIEVTYDETEDEIVCEWVDK